MSGHRIKSAVTELRRVNKGHVTLKEEPLINNHWQRSYFKQGSLGKDLPLIDPY